MTDLVDKEQGSALNERSTAELVRRASEQISTLIRDELKLAQLELARKGKHAGIGIGLFSGAGVFIFYGVGALVATAILALALVVDNWLAALIVAVALLLIAGIMALIGTRQVKQASPPVPQDAVDSVKVDIETVTEAVRETRGHR
jgi:Flp pilus assembly protein TadB